MPCGTTIFIWTSAGYRSEHIGGSQPNPGTGFGYNIRGVAPYWRFAWQQSDWQDTV